MNQCVPSWDLDENLVPPKINLHAQSNSSNSLPSHVPSYVIDLLASSFLSSLINSYLLCLLLICS